MMHSFRRPSVSIRKIARIAAIAAPILVILWFGRRVAIDAFVVIAGAAVLCFLIDPLARLFERKLRRDPAVLCALAASFGLLIAFLYFLLPPLIAESIQLTHRLPDSISLIRNWFAGAERWLENYLPGIALPSPSLNSDQLPTIARGTFRFAGSIADAFYRLSLMIVLAYFFMRDKERLLILIELAIPSAFRKTAVRMGNCVCRELRTYLRGQSIIAGAVGTLTAVGLALTGLHSAVVLGAIVGLLNMIPYFGPLIGAVPAVLAALGSGWQATLMTVAVLWLVQQIDSTLLSPRIMSSMTGISPAVVLLSLFVGSGLGGIVGMLFAMPVVMTIRTVFRVFVQRHENV